MNAQRRRFGSALHAASCGGYDAIVRLLLEQGADVNAEVNALQEMLLQSCDTIVPTAGARHGHEYTGGWLGCATGLFDI